MNKEELQECIKNSFEKLKECDDYEKLNFLKKELYETFIYNIIDDGFNNIEEIKEFAKEVIKASDIYC